MTHAAFQYKQTAEEKVQMQIVTRSLHIFLPKPPAAPATSAIATCAEGMCVCVRERGGWV